MKTKSVISFVFVWTGFILLQTLSVFAFSGSEKIVFITDAALRGILSAMAALAVKSVVNYGVSFEKFRFQQAINAFGLLLVFVAFTVGLAFLLNCLIFSIERANVLLNFIPINVFIAVLTFALTAVFYKNKNYKKTAETQVSEFPEIIPQPKEQNAYLEKITVKTAQKLNVIAISEILYLQADGDYVQIHCAAGKFLKEQTMKYFDENLPQDIFVRIHRSFIVNIHSISRIERYEKQTQILFLKNGEKLKISAAGYQILKIRLGI